MADHLASFAQRWDEGPCYICSVHVPPGKGWHKEDFDGMQRHWCDAHQPVWSRAYDSVTPRRGGPHSLGCDYIVTGGTIVCNCPEARSLLASAETLEARCQRAEAERDEARRERDDAQSALEYVRDEVMDGVLIESEKALARVARLEAALRDLIPWAGKQTFENDAVWVNARAALLEES